ncbi:MAG: T9SS type A sorting domain-containing protein [Bacteroidetes bacterium]|nr:T9SS type A sorting domain-containing protein [Bacteroidota bacterium]
MLLFIQPASQLQINSDKIISSISIYTISGTNLLTLNEATDFHQISISALLPGCYVVQILIEDEVVVRNFLKL